MFEASEIKRLISENMNAEFVEVEGADGVHFQAVVVSPEFEGLTLIQQHRMVKATLGNRLEQEIHALGLKTYTPQRWAEVRQSLGY